MDSAADADVRENLADLVRINRYFGGHAAMLRRLSALEAQDAAFTMLDVGAASGDHAKSVVRRFPRASVVSLDLSMRNLADASGPCVQADAFRLPFASGAFDYVCCNLFLHHFEDARVVELLSEFGRVARRAVIVTDLERHFVPARFLSATRWLFRWSWLTVYDGRLSVRAAFRPGELSELAVRAGLRDAQVARHHPWFRLSMVALVPWLLFSACAKRYRVEGMVLDVDRAAGSMVVAHRPVAGFMPAMTMPFRVDPEELRGVAPGARVAFDLRVRGGASRATKLRVEDTRGGDDGFRFPEPAEKLAVGASVPDFALTTHDGSLLRLSDLRGKAVAINFIYTRCPLPEVCPRLSAVFAALQRRFRDDIPARLALLSITLDPDYDTPEVLARYAKSVGAREGWRFATGATAEVARRFGVVHWAEEGMIVHTSASPVIGPDGKLVALVEGSSFRLEHMASLMDRQISAIRR